jgi:adenylate cyclase
MAARKELSRGATAALAGAGVAVLVLALRATLPGELMELRTRDVRMRWTLPAEREHPEVELVMITDESIAWVAAETKRSWPWPRDVIAALFKGCALGPAKGIFFDLFTLVDKDPFDKELAKQLKVSPPSWLAAPFRDSGALRGSSSEKRPDFDELLRRYEVKADLDGSVSIPEAGETVDLPQPAIAAEATGVCDVATPRDRDGSLRRYRLLSRFRGRYYPSMALAALLTRERTREVRVRDGMLSVAGISVPVDREGCLRIRYYSSPARYRPASPILAGVWEIEDEGKSKTFDPSVFRGKLTIVGTNAAGLFDLRVTPVAEVMPGSEIHATVLRNLLEGRRLQEASWGIGAAIVLGLAMAAAFATRFLPALPGAGAAAALTAAWGAASTGLFAAGWITDAAAPMGAALLAYAATSGVNFLYEGRQRLKVKREFQRYLSPKVVEKILRQPDALNLAGERKPLTVFFMDFAGFTAMSEKLDPAELVKLISEYHNEAAEEIFATEGTVDKYIGDAIMAFWNDPIDQEDHALRACLSAVGAQKRLVEMARKMQARGLPAMSARIGINTGIATVGNMGAKGQVNYTVIGDEVNLASRLEGVNKEFGTAVIISESTYQPAKERLEVRELALIKVKGKKLPVRVYELLGLKGEVEADRIARARRFEDGLGELRARRFTKAWEVFTSLGAQGDPAAGVYAGVCEGYQQTPPPADWDGSYQMEHK